MVWRLLPEARKWDDPDLDGKCARTNGSIRILKENVPEQGHMEQISNGFEVASGSWKMGRSGSGRKCARTEPYETNFQRFWGCFRDLENGSIRICKENVPKQSHTVWSKFPMVWRLPHRAGKCIDPDLEGKCVRTEPYEANLQWFGSCLRELENGSIRIWKENVPEHGHMEQISNGFDAAYGSWKMGRSGSGRKMCQDRAIWSKFPMVLKLPPGAGKLVDRSGSGMKMCQNTAVWSKSEWVLELAYTYSCKKCWWTWGTVLTFVICVCKTNQSCCLPLLAYALFAFALVLALACLPLLLFACLLLALPYIGLPLLALGCA